jgi:hypothetical protein
MNATAVNASVSPRLSPAPTWGAHRPSFHADLADALGRQGTPVVIGPLTRVEGADCNTDLEFAEAGEADKSTSSALVGIQAGVGLQSTGRAPTFASKTALGPRARPWWLRSAWEIFVADSNLGIGATPFPRASGYCQRGQGHAQQVPDGVMGREFTKCVYHRR